MSAEIAIRQLAGVVAGLARRNVALEEVADGVDLEALDFDDMVARVDWADYRRILDNALARLGARTLREIGRESLYTDDAMLFRANLLLGYDDVVEALESMCAPNGVFRTIVPVMQSDTSQQGPRTVIVSAVMDPGYEHSPGHFEFSAGTIAEFPRILFEKPATVTLEPREGGTNYRVQFPRPNLTGALRRRLARSRRNPLFLRVVGEVFVELSERQANLQRETELRLASEDRLRRAERMDALGQLTGGVAHDFNNLLHIMQGNLDLLRDGVRSEDGGLLEAVEAAVGRGADLTKQLLAFGRQSPLKPVALDLDVIVREMQALLERTLGEQISIETDLQDAGSRVQADLGLLQNALINVALNARDAMPQGGKLRIETARVAVRADELDPGESAVPGDYVVVALSDTGVGMAEDVLLRCFDPFFTTKPAGAGSGLGLAMVYGFIKQSNGMVRVHSREGEGTAVRIFLPVGETVSEQPPGEPEAPPDGNGEVVLVVEDDPNVRGTVVLQLEQLGYQPVAAANAISARETLSARRDIAIVLTDVVLPGGASGLDLARETLAVSPELPVVFMSGYPDAGGAGELPPECLHLTKPFQQTELARVLHSAVARPA